MLKWLTKLRKKLWLTKRERWAAGWAYARQRVHDAPPNAKGKALIALMDLPLEFNHSFDQGILGYCEYYLKTERKYL